MNGVKTFSLLTILTLLLIAIGALIDQVFKTSHFMLIMFVLSMAMNVGAYFFSSKIVLKMYNAQPLPEGEHADIHRMVERCAAAANIPKPATYWIPSELPNAFATGRNPKHGVVAVTAGIVKLMQPAELEGVIAHEIAHIKNRDTLISCVSAMIAGGISQVANMAQWGLIFGGGNSDEEGGNPLAFVGLIVGIIVAPIVAMALQMAISRSREFAADETAAYITGNPDGLASGLARLETFMRGVPPEAAAHETVSGTQHMMIVNPLSGGGGGFGRIANLFSTHPPTEKRIAALREVQRKMMTGGGMGRSLAAGSIG